MRYSTNREMKISEHLRSLGIMNASDLSIENFCTLFDIDVCFQNDKSHCLFDEDFAVIFIDNQLSHREQRQVFFHELAHVLWHHGSQINMPKQLMMLQEEQASFISLYYAMPRYLLLPILDQYQSIDVLADYFDLPASMVIKRCKSFQREQTRIVTQTQLEYTHWKRKKTSLQPEKIYEGTKKVLNQLALQVGEDSIHYDIRRLL